MRGVELSFHKDAKDLKNQQGVLHFNNINSFRKFFQCAKSSTSKRMNKTNMTTYESTRQPTAFLSKRNKPLKDDALGSDVKP
jgi:hypothetical protein